MAFFAHLLDPDLYRSDRDYDHMFRKLLEFNATSSQRWDHQDFPGETNLKIASADRFHRRRRPPDILRAVRRLSARAAALRVVPGG